MQISLDENGLAVWVIESPRQMRQYVIELKNQSEGKTGNFVLSDNGKEISLDKKMEVLFTPFDVDLNDKKCWNKVSGELKNMALDESHYVQTQQLFAAIQQYFLSLELDSELDVSFEEPEFGQLLKAVGMKLEEDEQNMLNQLVQYLRILSRLFRKECIVFVNLSSFLEKEELEALLQQAWYMKLRVLLLESREISLPYEKKRYIIDKDGCEIY